MEELASINALYVEAKSELEGTRADAAELEELRELKSDIERKEKQQAAIIDQQVCVCGWGGGGVTGAQGLGLRRQPDAVHCRLWLLAHVRFHNRTPTSSMNGTQAKRLEELEKLYKEEQITRKRYFNQMEDMKGKIRVFCRVRPMLTFESDKGQTAALMIPDELTVAHLWKDEKKPREYSFDTVGCAPGRGGA